jgi:zinc protease
MTLDSELQMNPSILHGKTVGGLTYYVTNTTNPPDRVHLRLVVKAGSNHEAEDEHGLAHLIEHLAFRAHTMGLTPQQLAPRQNAADEFLSKIGAMLGPDSNACTTYDRTCSYFDPPGLSDVF